MPVTVREIKGTSQDFNNRVQDIVEDIDKCIREEEKSLTYSVDVSSNFPSDDLLASSLAREVLDIFIEKGGWKYGLIDRSLRGSASLGEHTTLTLSVKPIREAWPKPYRYRVLASAEKLSLFWLFPLSILILVGLYFLV